MRGAMLVGQALWERDVPNNQIRHGDAGGKEHRRLQAQFRRQAADRGAKDEADTENGAQSAEELATFLRRNDIAYVGEENADITARQPVDGAPEEEDP